MTTRATLSTEQNTLKLSGILDYESVLAIDAQGRDWLRTSAPQDCSVDLSMVTYSNSVGIALLLGWLRIAREHKKNLKIFPLPQNIKALAKVSGLDEILKDEQLDGREMSLDG